MAYDIALMLVNDLKHHLATLARAIDTALDDGTISTWEGFGLGMKGMQLGTSVMALLQGAPPAVRKEVLHVLEHAVFTMPPGH